MRAVVASRKSHLFTRLLSTLMEQSAYFSLVAGKCSQGAIRQLKEQNEVVEQGEKCGARYRKAGVPAVSAAGGGS
jgi:hypothetical protein